MNDDYRVTSEVYRLMPPQKGARSDLGGALDAVKASGSVREALDAASGVAPESTEVGDVSSPDPSAARQRARRVGRALARANWLLIMTVVGTIATIVGVVIAYLALLKPH